MNKKLNLNENCKVIKMFETVEQYIEEKGIEKGMEKGIEKGMEKGIEKGIEKGRSGLLIQIIKSGMMTIDQIVQATGEKYEYIKNMFQSVQQEAAC